MTGLWLPSPASSPPRLPASSAYVCPGMAFTVSRMHGAASRPGPDSSLTRCSLLVLLLVDANALGDLGRTHRVWCLAAWMPWSTAPHTSCICPVLGSCKVDALTGVIQAYSGVNIIKGNL